MKNNATKAHEIIIMANEVTIVVAKNTSGIIGIAALTRFSDNSLSFLAFDFSTPPRILLQILCHAVKSILFHLKN